MNMKQINQLVCRNGPTLPEKINILINLNLLYMKVLLLKFKFCWLIGFGEEGF